MCTFTCLVYCDVTWCCIKKVPKKDIIIIQGYFNGKIGPDAYVEWQGTIGRYGVGTTNDRGLRLLEFASSQRLTIAKTNNQLRRIRDGGEQREKQSNGKHR